MEIINEVKRMKAKESWDSISPEERVCNSLLEHLSEKILLSNWDNLPEHIRNHLIILLS